LEPSDWCKLDNESPDKRKRTKCKRHEILIGIEWPGLDSLSSDFNHAHLDNESEGGHSNEQEVVEEPGENVDFTFFDLSGIDLVEKLHEDEDLED